MSDTNKSEVGLPFRRTLSVLAVGALATSISAATSIVVDVVGTTQPPSAATNDSHLTLLAIVIAFLGVVFACLGFALFVVGATGSFTGGADKSKTGSIRVETTAPGLVVMVCATIVIFLSTDLVARPASVPTAGSEPAAASPK